MASILIFIAAFLLIFGITVVIPNLPPGEILYVYLEISEISSPFPSISGVVLINGIINGLFWGTIIVAIASVVGRPFRKKVLLPTRVPGYTTSRASTDNYVPPKNIIEKPIYKVSKRRKRAPLDHRVSIIEGIGPVYSKRLRRAGVMTVDDLLNEGYDRSGRYYLAREVGVSSSTILRWVYRADFLRIGGIGKQYSSLLESAGVNSISDLSRRNPDRLYERLKEINWRKNLVRRNPPFFMVKDWIERAKRLRPIVI